MQSISLSMAVLSCWAHTSTCWIGTSNVGVFQAPFNWHITICGLSMALVVLGRMNARKYLNYSTVCKIGPWQSCTIDVQTMRKYKRSRVNNTTHSCWCWVRTLDYETLSNYWDKMEMVLFFGSYKEEKWHNAKLEGMIQAWNNFAERTKGFPIQSLDSSWVMNLTCRMEVWNSVRDGGFARIDC